ncbi:MAG: hypothetical protein PHS54_01770 [Clostridia bacterium]|nr:hypothetical protein [Clostridia bacterium]
MEYEGDQAVYGIDEGKILYIEKDRRKERIGKVSDYDYSLLTVKKKTFNQNNYLLSESDNEVQFE